MSKSYPITRNCNFESRDDAEGKAIHAARKAVESGRCDWPCVIDAMDDLEDVLIQHADSGSEQSVRLCTEAERPVVDAFAAWAASQDEEI